MLIRQETKNDYSEIYHLIKEAFLSAEYADGTEQDLVVALRKGNAFVPELSLVAQDNEKLVGYILFTKGKVGDDTVLVLAPLAVLPEYQCQGVGTALIQEGHKIAEKLGYSYSIVLGSATYYSRFGYQPAEKFGIVVPHGIPTDHFMVIKLKKDAKPVRGCVTYAKEFSI